MVICQQCVEMKPCNGALGAPREGRDDKGEDGVIEGAGRGREWLQTRFVRRSVEYAVTPVSDTRSVC